MIPFRTILNWLTAHNLSDSAEVWVLGAKSVEPVLQVQPLSSGNAEVETASVWSKPAPVPLQYGSFYDTLLRSYSGGGTLEWQDHYQDTYRGSYTVNPQTAVFLLFLPDEIQLIETHAEKMEQRRKQAKELTEVIERSWDT